jgi:hypothetical protein
MESVRDTIGLFTPLKFEDIVNQTNYVEYIENIVYNNLNSQQQNIRKLIEMSVNNYEMRTIININPALSSKKNIHKYISNTPAGYCRCINNIMKIIFSIAKNDPLYNDLYKKSKQMCNICNNKYHNTILKYSKLMNVNIDFNTLVTDIYSNIRQEGVLYSNIGIDYELYNFAYLQQNINIANKYLQNYDELMLIPNVIIEHNNINLCEIDCLLVFVRNTQVFIIKYYEIKLNAADIFESYIKHKRVFDIISTDKTFKLACNSYYGDKLLLTYNSFAHVSDFNNIFRGIISNVGLTKEHKMVMYYITNHRNILNRKTILYYINRVYNKNKLYKYSKYIDIINMFNKHKMILYHSFS